MNAAAPSRCARRVERDEFDAFLRLIIAGGHSSFEYNQNAYSIHAPQQQGVPLALAISQSVLEGRGAWRLQGGGFAGTIQAFVPLDLLDTYRAAIDGVFGAGQLPTSSPCATTARSRLCPNC